ncbi:hypothetical protein [Melghirimyces profundicolus]|nr:hypothetical protein [Melghirimyces profundicolus]
MMAPMDPGAMDPCMMYQQMRMCHRMERHMMGQYMMSCGYPPMRESSSSMYMGSSHCGC